MKKTMKIICSLIALTLLLSFAGCRDLDIFGPGGGDGGFENPEGLPVLTVWGSIPVDLPNYNQILSVDPENKSALLVKNVIKGFEAEYDCKIKLLNKGWDGDLNEALLKAIKSNETVDVVCGERFIKAYIDAGHFAEIDLGEYDGKIIESALTPGQKNGKTYAVPVLSGSFGLCVNKKALRSAGVIDDNDEPAQKYIDAGIDPLAPAYWEDLLEICQDIKATYTAQSKDNYGGIVMNMTKNDSSWRSLTYMRSAGGAMFDEGQDKFVLDSAENQRAYDMMRALNAVSPAGSINYQYVSELVDTVFNGFAAYMVEGLDFVIRSDGKSYESDMIVAELPMFKGVETKSNVLTGTVYYSIMQKSKQKELGEAFIKYMLRDWVQMQCLENGFRVPVVKDFLAGEDIKEANNYSRMAPFFKPFIDASYNFSGGIPSVPKNASLVWDTWYDFIQDLYLTSEGVASLSGRYNTEINEMKDRE